MTIHTCTTCSKSFRKQNIFNKYLPSCNKVAEDDTNIQPKRIVVEDNIWLDDNINSPVEAPECTSHDIWTGLGIIAESV